MFAELVPGEGGDASQRLARLVHDVLVAGHQSLRPGDTHDVEEQVIEVPAQGDHRGRVVVLVDDPVDAVLHDLSLGRRIRGAAAVAHQLEDAQVQTGYAAQHQRIRRSLG